MRGGFKNPLAGGGTLAGTGYWRVLSDTPADGPWNMAVDEAIARAVGAGRVAPTIRFYAWSRPTVSLGCFQSARAAVSRQACDGLGVGTVRRLTGGRAVLHDDELTYSVCVPLSPWWARLTVTESFGLIGEGIVVGLRSLGVAGTLAKAGRSPCVRADACFQLPRMPAILVAGKKLVGSAQRRCKGALLQHGSLLLDLDLTMHEAVLPGWPRGDPAQGVTWLKALLQQTPPRGDIERALLNGWSTVLDIRGVPGKLTSAERRDAKRLVATRYATPAWTWRR